MKKENHVIAVTRIEEEEWNFRKEFLRRHLMIKQM